MVKEKQVIYNFFLKYLTLTHNKIKLNLCFYYNYMYLSLAHYERKIMHLKVTKIEV